jgi:hypothetical protein
MKDLIPFEEAYELKELEFDEECFGFYDAYNGDSHLFLHDRYKPLWLVRTWRRLFSKSSEETTFVSQFYVEYINGVCLAPTFSQAFRFFREKYNLHRHICYFEDTKVWHGDVYNIKTGGLMNHPMELTNYNSYEEAELACLKKLIKLVKQKQ